MNAASRNVGVRRAAAWRRTFVPAVAEAWRNLHGQGARATLSVLSVALGVFTTLTVWGLVRGAMDRVLDQTTSGEAGTVLVTRYPAAPERCSGSAGCAWRHNPPLNERTERGLRSLGASGFVTSHLTKIVPVRGALYYKVYAQLDAFTADWPLVTRADVVEGRSFLDSEDEEGSRVILVSRELARAVFPPGRVVGRELSIGSETFRVIGIYRAPTSFLTRARQAMYTPTVVVPLRTAIGVLRVPDADLHLLIRPQPAEDLHAAVGAIRSKLRLVRALQLDDPDDFSIASDRELFAVYERVRAAATGTALTLASLSLIMAIVGVASAVAMSVLNRRAEFAVRRSVGASRRDIRLMLAAEASLLMIVGSSAGLAVATAFGMALTAWSSARYQQPPLAQSVAFLVAVCAGLGLGTLPGLRALTRDPASSLA